MEGKSTVNEILLRKSLGIDFDCSVDFSWVRFEEIAESVLGRWSKPHVATLMQSALLDLKSLLDRGGVLLNVHTSDLPSLSRKYLSMKRFVW